MNFFQQFSQQPQQSVPGFAGGMVNVGGYQPEPLPENPFVGQNGVQEAMANNEAMRPPEPAPQRPKGLRNILGTIGDALLVANGAPPMYAQRQQERQMKHALRNYFTNPEATVRELMQVDPELALKVHQGLQPKAAQVPSAVREYEYVQGLPEDQRSGYMDFRRSMVPSFMSPITLGPYDEYIGGGAQGGETTATGPNGEKVRLNPQTGQWEPMGGAAGNASPQTFPVGG